MNSPVIEPVYGARKLHELTGGTYSESEIRAAMNRKGKANNPLPHIKSGRNRKTTISAFKEWAAREMELSINA